MVWHVCLSLSNIGNSYYSYIKLIPNYTSSTNIVILTKYILSRESGTLSTTLEIVIRNTPNLNADNILNTELKNVTESQEMQLHDISYPQKK